MKSTLYILCKSDMLESIIDIKDREIKLPKYLTVVFKSSGGEMGFMHDQIGVDYILEYLIGTVLWDYKKSKFIDFYSKLDIVNYKHKINGLTFFNNSTNLNKLKEQILLIQSINRKNEIFRRHGKSILKVPSSPVLEYLYNDKIYIRNILELKVKFNSYIIWDWGEFGLYFHIISDDFPMEIKRIESVCRDLNIEVSVKDNEENVPSW